MSKRDTFYKSRAWRNLRDNYFREKGGLCEVCYANGEIVPGEIVHHITHLDGDNVDDPTVALNPRNLQLVCRKCHAAQHPELYGSKRYKVDEYGRIIIKQ